jgi:hypothetical protein
MNRHLKTMKDRSISQVKLRRWKEWWERRVNG